MEPTDKNNASILLRLPEDLKVALQRQAFANGRRITSEINTRLRDSLKEPKPVIAHGYPQVDHIKPLKAETPDLNNHLVLTPSDHAMLDIFRAMPPEKQLALLSLFR